MREAYRKLARIALVLIYLVIIAGAVVRMTGSGMGCPDWPRCFGYWIPPTEESQLLWEPQHPYKEGQVIIREESLKVAQKDLTSGISYDPSNWRTYEAHDHAVFNKWHTWIEYINRLLGALAGIPILLMAVVSIFFRKEQPRVTVLSWLLLFAMGFQAWLGKVVVDSNLVPYKITIHMVMALVIVALLLYLLYLVQKERAHNETSDRLFNNILILTVFLTLVQIVMGTQVRQFVDGQVELVGYERRDLWLSNPSVVFHAHRTFSVVVLVLNGYLFSRNRKKDLALNKINWVMVLLLIEVLTGILMYYADFPFGSQPLHLVMAALIFGVQFYLLLETKVFDDAAARGVPQER